MMAFGRIGLPEGFCFEQAICRKLALRVLLAHRLPFGHDEHMDLEAVGISFLAGMVAAIGFVSTELGPWEAIVVANRNGKRIDAVDGHSTVKVAT